MSEESLNQTIRDFFDVRYALPGWVFIIFSLLWNRQIANLLLGNLLALLGIFVAGIPVGYILCQIWYSLFYIKNNKDHLKLLDDYGVKKDLLIRRTVCDYIFNLYVDNKLKAYINRRWAFINILGSSVVSLIIATIFGWLCATYVTPKESPSYYFSLWIFGFIFLILFIKGYVNILQEYEKMNVIIVNSILASGNKRHSILNVIRKSGYLIEKTNGVNETKNEKINDKSKKGYGWRDFSYRGYRIHEIILVLIYLFIPLIVCVIINKNGSQNFSSLWRLFYSLFEKMNYPTGILEVS
jgi:hypothetical protein